MNTITRRDMLCNQIHTDLGDMIIETGGLQTEFVIPMVGEKGDVVSVCNYLRGVGYTVTLVEMNKNFLFELLVTWN